MMSDSTGVKESLCRAVKNGDLEKVTQLVNQYSLSYCPDWSEGYILLCDAIQFRQFDVAEFLLEKGAKVNCEIDPAPLHLAVEENCLEIVESLIERGAQINCRSELRDNCTALHIGCKKSFAEIVVTLLNSGADASAKANDDTTPLHLAVERESLLIVESLLQHQAQVNSSKLSNNHTPLHTACLSAKIDIIECLLAHGADLNAKSINDETPLYCAIQRENVPIINNRKKHWGQVNCLGLSHSALPLNEVRLSHAVQIVDLLLESGADPNVTTSNGTNPLILAVERKSVLIIESLVKRGALINYARPSDHYTALHVGCEKGGIDTIECLLNLGADPNVKAKDHVTPLHVSVDKQSNLKTIQSLINHGAELNPSRLQDHFTPLHIASGLLERVVNHLQLMDTVEYLLECGADPNVKANNNVTPLFLAVEKNRFEIVRSLLRYGARVNCPRHSDNYTPLHVACKKTFFGVADILLNYGANPNFKGIDGRTPLHLLVEFDDLFIDKFFDHFADINAETCEGFTPLHLAQKMGMDCRFLQERVIRLKVAGFYVSEKVLNLLPQGLNENLRLFQECCEEDVKKMKSKVIGSFTLYDVLRKQRNPKYVINLLELQALKSDYFLGFGYRSLILSCVKSIQARVELLPSSQYWLGVLLKTSNVFNEKKCPYFPPELLIEILSYLSIPDLTELCLCGEDLKRQVCPQAHPVERFSFNETSLPACCQKSMKEVVMPIFLA